MNTLEPGQFKPPSVAAGNDARKWLYVGIGLAVVIVGGLVVSSMGSDREPYDPNNSYEAIAQCEDLVTENLKAPSTAEFDSSASGFGTWTVTGTVDAENSFGAMLRSEFQCTVVVSGDSIKRRLDYLE